MMEAGTPVLQPLLLGLRPACLAGGMRAGGGRRDRRDQCHWELWLLRPLSSPLQPLPMGWGSLTPRDSHPQERILPGASGAPPAAPSSPLSSSLCPREDPSGARSPSEDKGLIEAPRPGSGGGEGCRAE